MQVTAVEPSGVMILRNTEWDLYTHFVRDLDSPGTRVTYDQGALQIMVLSAAHENCNRILATVVDGVAEETNTQYCALGSTTFQRAGLLKGFEPDSCFYFEHADAVSEKDRIDADVDPPPDLLIEIDITSRSMDRLPIFAAFGVREVWRWCGSVEILVLSDDGYRRANRSSVLPLLTAEILTKFVTSGRRDRLGWLKSARQWVREQLQ